MPTPPTPDTGADFTNQFISDKYTSLLHLSGAKLTSDFATGQTAHGVYDGVGNYTGMGVTTTNISFNNITMPKSVTDTTLVDYLFPVGSIFMSIDDVNPGERMLGAGQGNVDTVWELVSKGLFLAGVGTGTDSNGVEKTITAGDRLAANPEEQIGEYTHTLTVEEAPDHTHKAIGDGPDEQYYTINDKNSTPQSTGAHGPSDGPNTGGDAQWWPYVGQVWGASPTAEAESVGGSHNNMPPSFGLYVWKRIS